MRPLRRIRRWMSRRRDRRAMARFEALTAVLARTAMRGGTR